MRALIVACLIATGLMTTIGLDSAAESIPAWYYHSPCQQPANQDLHEWLAELPWHGEIEFGGWDCSQMSARIEWLCENCGYDAEIHCKDGPAKLGHCWVVIEGEVYEATGNYWADASLPIYKADVIYADIGDTSGAAAEWGWWLTYPELKKEH